MRGVFQESFIGQCIYHASSRRLLKYPEEQPDFILPDRYRSVTFPPHPPQNYRNNNEDGSPTPTPTPADSNGRLRTASSSRTCVAQPAVGGITEEVEGEGVGEKQEVIVVEWYGEDDPENPQNWGLFKKSWLTFCIMFISTAVYVGSSIYSPAISDAASYFGVSNLVSTLGLSIFVVGYGVGPLFLSPITELPQIGRTIPYIIPLAIFCILQVPTALVTNFAGFLVLRFIAGFVSSPPLATGGASLFDVFSQLKVTYSMGLYDLGCAAGPTIGPIIAGYAVDAKGWRWSFYEMIWISGFALALLSFTLPETSADNILYRRAHRLRRLTGNPAIRSLTEIQSATQSHTFSDALITALVRPISMTFKEPIIIAINLYIGYVYALLYSFFESFPLVYGPEGYNLAGGSANLPFAALLVGEFFSFVGYALWAWFYYEKVFIAQKGVINPEEALPMAIPGAFCMTISLFFFAWTANRTSFWAPICASGVFGLGTTWMFMPFLTYLPLAYPRYAASSLASNDFVRSMLGAGMPLAASPLFHNLGIAWGNSLLGFVSLVFLPVPWIIYKYGARLRNVSPMALHDNELENMREKHPEVVPESQLASEQSEREGRGRGTATAAEGDGGDGSRTV